ncbi:hypothetical protein ABID37_004747 [Aquamicrobium terrae]|uniref:Nucleotidyl transferase AbiEii/AbiGii toxin family protein n=1 Tax=Aquamicrobium terrae TaxID=1324945 RepID=A0ABV2N6R7_9HYPH
MSTAPYSQVIKTPARDRLDLFLATANRLGAPVGNIEKGFWVCWTLNALYHERPATAPRLLFKGGTSLSKAYGLIQRFSEDIDITVFREDLDEPASVEELEALSNKKRRAKLEAIRDTCRAYIPGPLREFLAEQLDDATDGAGRIEIDDADPDGQTLLVWYPEVEPRDDAYVRPTVRIESGAKSALDPNRAVTILPYIAEEAPTLELAVPGVTTVEATRTFWDKVVIAHGCAVGMSGAAYSDRKVSAYLGTITTSIAFSTQMSVAWPLRISHLGPIASGTQGCSSTGLTMIWPRPRREHLQSILLKEWSRHSRMTTPTQRR